jgi:hypothetical protein
MPRAFPRDGSVDAVALENAIRTGRYFYDNFGMPLRTGVYTDPDTDPAGTDTTVNVWDTGRHVFLYTNIGEATATLKPSLTTDGYPTFALEALLGQGFELNFGGILAGHPRNTLMGSEDAFFRALLAVDNASGIDLFFGFRRIEATAAALDTYTDIAGLRVLGDSSSAAAAISILTELNDDTAPTSVETTQTLADATDIELEVRVRENRYAEFRINGAETTVKVTGFRFDTGDVLCPVIHVLHTTDVFAEFKLKAVEGGPLNCRNASLLSAAA